MESLRIVILGLSITSSWGNGHATNYRGLVRALTARGHDVTFLERDVPWYASQRDLAEPPWGRTHLYASVDELTESFGSTISSADLVIVGSYVPQGVEVGSWVQATASGVVAFYDIDTPVTLAKLQRHDHEYLSPELIPGYDLYLSFTGGPTLRRIETTYGAPRARAFYCIADPSELYPEEQELRWELGYLGTYSDDRQPALEHLMLEAARAAPELRFVVAGPQYPENISWPDNVERIDHLPPARHRGFYNAQAFTLNTTRADMVGAGYSPSVRLFEAAACATPVISDWWPGLDEFFVRGQEILISTSADDTLRFIRDIDECDREAIGERARARVLQDHTAERRAQELEDLLEEVVSERRRQGVRT